MEWLDFFLIEDIFLFGVLWWKKIQKFLIPNFKWKITTVKESATTTPPGRLLSVVIFFAAWIDASPPINVCEDFFFFLILTIFWNFEEKIFFEKIYHQPPTPLYCHTPFPLGHTPSPQGLMGVPGAYIGVMRSKRGSHGVIKLIWDFFKNYGHTNGHTDIRT